jgi:hypothetical protein
MNTRNITRNNFPLLVVMALFAAVVIGFTRTYYFRFLFDLPPLTRLAHVHGILSTLWLVLHYTQARLIASHRVNVHMRLGLVGAALGIALIIQAGWLSLAGAAAGHAPPGRVPWQFLSVSLGTTFMFTLFFSAALSLRGHPEWHKRLMLLASAVLLMPAIGRIDGLMYLHFGTPRTVLPLIVTAGFVAWAVVNDRRRFGRVHPAYLHGGAVLLVAIPLRSWLGTTPAWRPFAEWVLQFAPGY